MALPATLNLQMKQGEDFSMDVTLYSDGVAVDLTGRTFYAYAKESEAFGAAIVFQFACAVSGTTLTLTCADTVTSAIEFGTKPDSRDSVLWWDLLQITGGLRDYPLSGRINIERRITDLA